MKILFNTLRLLLLYTGLIFIAVNISASPILPYKKIDSQLKITWEDTYPIEFKKIIKKDLLGKGIMVIKNKQNQLEYMYTFLLYIPRISIVEGIKTENEDGKEIIVKLIHTPSEKEKPYRIELGEFSEKYYQGNVVKWIK